MQNCINPHNNVFHTKDERKEPLNHSQEAKDPKMAYNKAILQEWYVSTQASPAVSVGYYYPGCTTEMLKLLDHAHEIVHADARHWRPISSDQAALEFQTALVNQPTKAQQECVARLKAAWTDPDWSPDVVMKSFFDLDAVYFGGLLREKCRIQWIGGAEALMKELKINVPKRWAGMTRRDRSGDVPTAKIRLNAEACLKNAKSLEFAKTETFGVLLHELLHGRFPPHTETETRKLINSVSVRSYQMYWTSSL